VDKECSSDEKPGHRVYLDAFRIDKTEVTFGQYRACVDAGRCHAPHVSDGTCNVWTGTAWDKGTLPSSVQGANQPVVCVDWDQANAYCGWKGRRLPTEAEWEKAARGTDGRKYSWGNAAYGSAGKVANIADRAAKGRFSGMSWATESYDDGFAETAPVGSFPAGASPYGALDMIGNVWEWVADWYKDTYYSEAPSKNPRGASSGSYRGLRGGSWNNLPENDRASGRNGFDSAYRSVNLGFRCAQ
jgi:serine/threonine-protein kinase